jgi:prepilin peptidase CpaA
MLIIIGALLAASLHDIIARTVPNWIAAALSVPGLAQHAVDGGLLGGILAGMIVFVLAALCWRRGWLGGGDVKLLGAAAVAMPANLVPTFIAAVALAGGILALFYLTAKRIIPAPMSKRPAGLIARIARVESWRIRRGGPLPYACAITAGALFVLL